MLVVVAWARLFPGLRELGSLSDLTAQRVEEERASDEAAAAMKRE